MRGHLGRIMAAVLFLLLAANGVLGLATAVKVFVPGPISTEGADVCVNLDEFLTVSHDPTPSTFTAATGEIRNTWNTCDWSSYACDSGVHVGVIANADPPRWQVTLRTIQPVRVYGDGTTIPLATPSWYYRAEAQHAGFARLMGETLIWDGAHFVVGNNESTVDDIWWKDASDVERLPLAHRVKSSGELNNRMVGDDGEPICVEATRSVYGSSMLVDWHSYTSKARLVHQPYHLMLNEQGFGFWYQHQVELGVNTDNSIADAGKFYGCAEAWDDATHMKVQTFVFD